MAKQKAKFPSTPVGRRRLLKLARLLEKDAGNAKGIKFDLSIWGYADLSKPKPVSCGTTACAMGLAVASGKFRSDGLKPMTREGDLEPRAGHKTGIPAAAKLFQITDREAEWFFLDESYPWDQRSGAKGERAVAKRIRDFVAGKVPPRTEF